MKKIALALGGGGARGLAHIGFLKVLEQEKIPVSRISGCSMGAIVGGIYAYQPRWETLYELAFKFIENPFFKQFNFDDFASLGDHGEDFSEKVFFMLAKLKAGLSLFKTLAKNSIYDEKLVCKVYSLFPDKKMEKLEIPFIAVATDLITGDEVVLNKGSLRKAMRASSSIPGYFPPVKYGKQMLVDGGVSDVVPVSAFEKQQNELIIGVDVEPEVSLIGDLSSGVDIILRSEIIRNYHLKRQKTNGADTIVQCPMGKLNWADFRHAERIIKAGETAATKLLPWLEKNL